MAGDDKKQLFLIAGAVFLGMGTLLFAPEVFAQIPSEGIIPQCDWRAGQTYGLGAFVKLAENILKLTWGILGSLALVMFVWGGFLWLTARGEENQIKQGWDTLINALIGIVIVLSSWVIINTVVFWLTSPNEPWKVATVFGGTQWTNLVKGDICIDVAANIAGFVPPPPSTVGWTPPPGVAPGAPPCKGTLPHDAKCTNDCECQSGECHNYGGGALKCRGGGTVAGPAPADSDRQGICCYVKGNGSKGATRKSRTNCEQYLYQNICFSGYNMKYQFWCPIISGKDPGETCWEKSAINVKDDDKRSANCRNAEPIGIKMDDCRIPSADPTKKGPS